MERIRKIFGNRPVKGILAVYCLFAVILLVSSISNMKAFPEEFQAPDFRVRDLFGGEDLTLEAHAGRPLIIYFFASW